MLLACLATVSFVAADVQAGPGCKACAEIKAKGEGFCDDCGAGMIYGLELKSRLLYDALAGDAEVIDDLKKACPGCKKAAETDGTCEHCNIHIAHGKMYLSKCAHAVARGATVDMAKVAKSECPGCQEAAKSGGFCTHCNVGFVANHQYKESSFYEAAKKALETITLAVKDAGHCEQCAVARVTDGTCSQCKVTYKDGMPTKS